MRTDWFPGLVLVMKLYQQARFSTVRQMKMRARDLKYQGWLKLSLYLYVVIVVNQCLRYRKPAITAIEHERNKSITTLFSANLV
jgi:hypothetical protein